MEWLDLGGRTDQAALGRAMGALHAAPCPVEERAAPFGFAVDNTIGATPQPNAPRSRDWVEFFRERRLAHQLELARSPTLARLGARLLPRLDELFDDLDGGAAVAPSVLHGDLWSGNIGAAGGAPCVFDPAVYVGHHEAEWGMSWCAGFSSEFWGGYREIVPKAPGFERRRPLYDLYHILNHANLFGGGYHDDAAALMKKCLKNLDS
jgi:protein-ribulosamine 3-kinase